MIVRIMSLFVVLSLGTAGSLQAQSSAQATLLERRAQIAAWLQSKRKQQPSMFARFKAALSNNKKAVAGTAAGAVAILFVFRYFFGETLYLKYGKGGTLDGNLFKVFGEKFSSNHDLNVLRFILGGSVDTGVKFTKTPFLQRNSTQTGSSAITKRGAVPTTGSETLRKPKPGSKTQLRK
jgi:hypothetical protein